ncbi:MAG: LamG-like jellyroll fold domain-containing protein [Candidatus Aenigmatarchaeota archaeon]
MPKAISTVIASVLMLMIVIALAGTAYLYISGTFTSKTATTFEIIESVNDTVTIRNSGTEAITYFSSLTIDGAPAVYLLLKDDVSLVGYWNLDEGSGTTAYDNSGNNNHGTLVNNPTWVAGKFGNALRFQNQMWHYVNIPDSDILDFGTSDFSVSFWYKAELPYTQAAPVSKKGSGWNDPGWVFITSPGSPTISFCGNTNAAACAGWNFGDTNWHHVVGVRIGGSLYIYGDGIFRSVISHPSYANSSSNNEPLRIGYDDGWYNSVNGIIDEVRIYNRLLSADEIRMLYTKGSLINIPPGHTTTIKIYNIATKGTHTLRLCTSSICNVAYLQIQ